MRTQEKISDASRGSEIDQDRSELLMTIARAIVSELARSDSSAKCSRDRSSSRKISASVERSSRSLRAIEDREEVMRGASRDRIVPMVDFMPDRHRERDCRCGSKMHAMSSECERVTTMLAMRNEERSRESVRDRCRGRGHGPRSRAQDPPSPGGQAGNRFGARTDPEKKVKKVPSEGPGPSRTSPWLGVENIGHTSGRKKR
jgi:hypothetical protein